MTMRNVFDRNLNDNNYKSTVRKLHDSGWKNVKVTSAGVAMLGNGCGVSNYLQLYDKNLENY